MQGLPHRVHLHGWGRLFLLLNNEVRVFSEVSFAGQFMTLDGIVHRVLVVWGLLIPTYFNCCHFFLNTISCRSPSGNQFIIIYRNDNLSFVTT